MAIIVKPTRRPAKSAKTKNARKQKQRSAARRPSPKVRRRVKQRKKKTWRPAPKAACPLLGALAPAFSRPTFQRFKVLLFAAILTIGNHTVLNLLRTVGNLAPGHHSTYHRFFSKCRWCSWRLARALAGYVLKRWVPQGVVPLVGDETVEEHRGKKVYGKGCHRDGVRSTHTYTAFCWGHKWVVLAILVKFPFARRPWALPVLVALYRSTDWNKEHGRKHKTPSELMRQLLAVMLHWFPERRFTFAGDGAYGTHELTRFAQRRRQRLTLISRFHADANLYAPPPPVTGKKKCGRPRVRGDKQPSPQQVVSETKRMQRLNVAWYGGGRRDVQVVSAIGHWYKAGHGLTEVRWVFVRDCTGTHREEYFFTTDIGMTPQAIIEAFTGRWSIETTFQEMRAYVKLETTRGRSEKTVLRAAPCLFGLFTVIALWYAEIPRVYCKKFITWKGKKDATFSDAITAVRRWLWVEWVFATPDHTTPFAKLCRPIKALLLCALAPAA